MTRVVLAAFALLATGAPCSAVARAAPADAAPADAQVQSFLSMLKAGKGSDAVQAVMASSPLWSKRPGASEQLVGQIDAAVKAYGPVVSYEKLPATDLGTMAIREYYLVQHRDMVTRWEFDLLRTSNGWIVGYFGFTDQPNNWFS